MPRATDPAATVAGLAPRKPICVDREITILTAWKLMRLYRVGELVVTDDHKGTQVPAGIISAQDIVTRVIGAGLDPAIFTAGDIASLELSSASGAETAPAPLFRIR